MSHGESSTVLCARNQAGEASASKTLTTKYLEGYNFGRGVVVCHTTNDHAWRLPKEMPGAMHSVDNWPDRASQLKALIESEICDCNFASVSAVACSDGGAGGGGRAIPSRLKKRGGGRKT